MQLKIGDCTLDINDCILSIDGVCETCFLPTIVEFSRAGTGGAVTSITNTDTWDKYGILINRGEPGIPSITFSAGITATSLTTTGDAEMYYIVVSPGGGTVTVVNTPGVFKSWSAAVFQEEFIFTVSSSHMLQNSASGTQTISLSPGSTDELIFIGAHGTSSTTFPVEFTAIGGFYAGACALADASAIDIDGVKIGGGSYWLAFGVSFVISDPP